MMERFLKLGIVLFLAIAGFPGCGDDGGSGGSSDDVPIPEDFPECGEPSAEYDAIGDDVNSFWKRTLDHSVRLCTYVAGDTIEGEELSGLNAFSTGLDIVYYDPRLLDAMSMGGSNELGPASILAHEWGHEIQVDYDQATGLSISIELQADCISGIYAGFLSQSDPTIEQGDIFLTYLEFCLLGDPQGYPWFAPDAHGTCIQRASSYNTGFKQGREVENSGSEVAVFTACPL